jgi:hypothetical protein
MRVLVVVSFVAACAGAEPAVTDRRPDGEWLTVERDGLTLRYRAVDASVAEELAATALEGRRRVEEFFEAPFLARFAVTIYPDREQLTAHWREAWGAPSLETECWMVASGSRDGLTMLSPRVWATQACEHDAADAVKTEALVRHELVHVFHEQRLAEPGFEGMDGVGWFVEGLAVHASGQLALGHLASASEAIAAGQAPRNLETAWSGKHKYGVCGTLVELVDRQVGRARLVDMLELRTEAALLGAIGTSESDLLAAWRDYVRSRTGGAETLR